MLCKRLILALAGMFIARVQQAGPQPGSFVDRVMHMSDSEVVTYVNSRLADGLKPDDYDRIGVLLRTRSSFVIPLIERRIEEVLSSSNPRERFTSPTADPEQFVLLAAAQIAWAGDEHAMDALNKLVAIDDKRFGRYVPNILYSAANHEVNPFWLAYHGLALGNSALSKRILAWVEAEAEPQPIGNGSLAPPRSPNYTRWWADAMLKKYGRAPNEVDWYSDPIASPYKSPIC